RRSSFCFSVSGRAEATSGASASPARPADWKNRRRSSASMDAPGVDDTPARGTMRVMRFPGVVFCLASAVSALAAPVTFNQQIAPILYQNCAPCHRPGEAAPFALLSYDDAKQHAGQIAAATKKRYMPPWLPEPGHGEFADERRLSTDQIELIQEWVKQGSPQGAGRGPQPPRFADE